MKSFFSSLRSFFSSSYSIPVNQDDFAIFMQTVIKPDGNRKSYFEVYVNVNRNNPSIKKPEYIAVFAGDGEELIKRLS